MKKILLLFAVFSFISIMKSLACAPSRVDKISGPQTVCFSTTEKYKLVNENCLLAVTDVRVSSNGTLVRDITNSTNEFEVRWENNGSSNATGQIEIDIQYFSGDCPSTFIQPSSKTVTYNVTILPKYPSVAQPNPISRTNAPTLLAKYDGYGFYQFSTTSSDSPDGYSWSVNGGTITNNYGNYIYIKGNSGSCVLTASVRAYRNNCAGIKQYSQSRGITYSLTTPSNPGSIMGDASITTSQNVQGFYLGSEEYSVSPVSGATGYHWSLSSSSSDLFIKTIGVPPVIPKGNTIEISARGAGFKSGTLFVRAFNTCGQSLSQSSVEITAASSIFSFSRFSSSNTHEEDGNTISPNPLKTNELVTFTKSNPSDKIYIRTIEGKTVMEVKESSIRNDFGLAEGIYLVDFVGNSGTTSQKLIISK